MIKSKKEEGKDIFLFVATTFSMTRIKYIDLDGKLTVGYCAEEFINALGTISATQIKELERPENVHT